MDGVARCYLGAYGLRIRKTEDEETWEGGNSLLNPLGMMKYAQSSSCLVTARDEISER